MADQVRLPGVGGVSRRALLIGGGAAALLITVLFLRKRSTSSTAAAAAAPAAGGDAYPPDGTTGNPGDPYSTDPATGMTYGDEAAQSGGTAAGYQDTSQGPTYGATGYYDPNTGQWVYGNSGTGQALAVTNQQWAQNAISYLSGTAGADPGALSAALGAYLAGQPVTSDQVSLIDQAIAAEGYPPQPGANNYPPGINESGTASQGGTGGSGGGVTGSGAAAGDGSGAGTGAASSPGTSAGTGAAPARWQYPAPYGLSAAGAGKGRISVSWTAVTGPQGQVPATYTVAYGRTSGAQTWKDTAAGTNIMLQTQAGMTEYIEVWANGGPVAPPHAGPVKATAGK